MQRYQIYLSYKGTAYHGWQTQPNAHTVQAEVNRALSIVFKQIIDCVGCGRTDTGVHAKLYVLHFDALIINVQNCYCPTKLAYKLNSILPKDIAVHSVSAVDSGFHARFNALNRTYKYFIHQNKDPFLNDFSCFCPYPLNINQMNLACQYLLGSHDFSCFSKSHTDVSNNICTIEHAQWQKVDGQLVFTITANRFLRNMVRAIVGTLLQVACGKIAAQQVQAIINTKDRGKAGTSVEAKGLFLWDITY